MFFEKEDGTKMGSIYWCKPGQQQQRSLKKDHMLPLHQLREIRLGKQTPIFSSRVVVAPLLFVNFFIVFNSSIFSLFNSLL